MTTTENRPVARTAVDGAWRLNVLGPVELCYDGNPVEVTGTTRTLLALLARTPCEEVGTATIIAGMWGSAPPEDSEKEVASCVSRLRKALTVVAPSVDPTSVVVTLPAGYILAIQPSNADILAFERLLADGRRAISVGQPALALHQLDAALRLWRGKAYQDYGEIAFARAEADRLEELRLAAVESRVDALLALSAPIAPPHLMTELQQLVAEHWHRERLWGQLMTVLVRLGRRADALAVHRRAQEQLSERLRVQPGAELRAVEEAVINRDPMLFGVPLEATTVPPALATTVPPCVGREEEVAWLCAALDLAATRRAQARLVVGSPGIGKSRLIAEVAQRAAERGVVIRYWRADVRGLETHVAEPDRLNLVIIEDLDQAQHEDVARVTAFVRSAMTRPVVTLVTCRDPVRVGDLASVPKLVLSALDDAAVAEIVRIYAPSATDKAAASAMANANGVPARIHKAASEWAFARAGRRIDRAVADAAEPRRMLTALRDEVVAGALDLAHVRARARVLRPVARSSGAPYPGLMGFGPADVETFHGRERLVADVLARVVEAPLLALVGEPGTGKSSLLRAGVLPAITAGVLPDSSRWRQVVVTPSTVSSLAELMAPPRAAMPVPNTLVTSNPLTTPTALMPLAAPQAGGRGRADEPVAEGETEDAFAMDEVADFAPAEPSPATQTPPTAALVDGKPAAGNPALRIPAPRQPVTVVAEDDDEPARTLLVVDQFEEVFAVLDAQAQADFVEALLHATNTGRVVLAMRSDFYRHCAQYPALARLVTANTVLMPAMTEEELRRAVQRPAAAAGLEVEPGLVDRLVAEVEDGNGGLAHLATTLRELWRHRNGTTLTLAGYQAGPDLAASIEAYAEAVFARLGTPQARTGGLALLLGLCRMTEDTVAVRVRANLTEVLAQAGAGALPALEVLAEGGLITVRPNVDVVELAHDCLLTEWPRLREAVEDAAAEAYLRRHLRRTAAAWAQGGRAATALYRGARLATVLDWAEKHGRELSTVEKEFLAAGQRAAQVVETRRQRRAVLLWKWLVATMLVAILATAVAAVSVTLHVRAAANAQRADAARLGVQALAEPDLRRSLLLAVAAARLEPANAGVIRTALQRTPDLVGTAGEGVTAVAISPDGATVAIGSTAGPIRLVRGDTLAQVATLDYPGHGPINGLIFTPDGHRLVTWGGSRTSAGTDAASIVVWDVASRRPTGTAFGQVWPDHGGGLLTDRVTLVLAQHGRDPQAPATLVGWNIEARTPSTAYPLPTSTVDSLVVSGDGARIAIGSGGGTVVLTVADGSTRQLAGARPLAFSPNGRTLVAATGPEAASVQVWDLTRGEARTFQAHRGQVHAAAWAPDGSSFATVGEDGTAVVWNSASLTPVRSFSAGPLPMSAVAFASDNRTLYTVGAGGTMVAWDLTGSRGIATTLSGTTDGDAGLLTLACTLAGRDLTPQEWQTYLPDRPYQDVCPG
jgi:DNA-binding SARP family transcriptional activator/WD40 repeat protein/predicted AAA+ superfamily ATPase